MRQNVWYPPGARDSNDEHPLDELVIAQERVSRAPSRDAQIAVARAALVELEPVIEGMDGVRVEIKASHGLHYEAEDYAQLQIVKGTDVVVLGAFDNLASLDLTNQYGSVEIGIMVKSAAMWKETGAVVNSNPYMPTYAPVTGIKSIRY